LNLIKGYVWYYDEKIPVTWEKETKKYAKDVRKVLLKENQLIVDQRIFDEKIPKKEILDIKNVSS